MIWGAACLSAFSGAQHASCIVAAGVRLYKDAVWAGCTTGTCGTTSCGHNMRVVSFAASLFGVIDHIRTTHCTIMCCFVRPICMIVCNISPLIHAPSDAQFNKVQNAAPDLSAVNEPLTDSTGLPNPFDKGSGGIPRASDITELAARAKKEVRGLPGSGQC